MTVSLRKILGKLPIIKIFLIRIYEVYFEIVFSIYQTLNIKIFYPLVNKSKVKFFSKGQIAKGLFLHEFEKNELDAFQSLVNQGSIIIDAGANIGLYSIIGSKLVGDSGRIYSFEPSKTTFNLFKNNILLNQVTNITAINKGLGDKMGETLILNHNNETGDAENYISNSTLNNLESVNDGSAEVIVIDSLDNFQYENSISKVDFLKVDVEGYEYYVLKGAENLLRENPDIIILFECADHLAKRAGSSQNEVFNFLNKLGFELAYWNEKLKKWICDKTDPINSGQFLASRNIFTILQKLTDKSIS